MSFFKKKRANKVALVTIILLGSMLPLFSISAGNRSVAVGYDTVLNKLCAGTSYGYPLIEWSELISCVSALSASSDVDGDSQDYFSHIKEFLRIKRDEIPESQYFYWSALISQNEGQVDEYEKLIRKSAELGNKEAIYEMFNITGDRKYLIKSANLGEAGAVRIFAGELATGAQGRSGRVAAAKFIEKFALQGSSQLIDDLDTEIEYLDSSRVPFWRVVFALMETAERPPLPSMSNVEWADVCLLARKYPRVMSNIKYLEQMQPETKKVAANFMRHCSRI